MKTSNLHTDTCEMFGNHHKYKEARGDLSSENVTKNVLELIEVIVIYVTER